MHRGLSPFSIHAFVMLMAFDDQSFFTDTSSTQSRSCFSRIGRFRNRCFVRRFSTWCDGPPVLHTGFFSSVALNRLPHLSHWSPPAFS